MAIATLIWSVLSSYLLFQSYQTDFSNSTRINNLLSTIFEYQTRYDRVYEKAYPQKQASPNTEVAEIDVPKETKDIELRETIESQNTDLNTNEKPTTAETAANTATPKKPETSDFPIKIENMTAQKVGTVLEIRFALRNKHSPQKTSGYVAGIAKIEDKDGKITYLSAPASVGIDQHGEPIRIRSAHSFSIRYYKAKMLKFDVPPNITGQFKEITIIVDDRNGRRVAYPFQYSNGELKTEKEKRSAGRKTYRDYKIALRDLVNRVFPN